MKNQVSFFRWRLTKSEHLFRPATIEDSLMDYARPVVPDAAQRAQLERLARAQSLPASMVERSKVALLFAEGKPDLEIATQIGLSPKKAARWRIRFLDVGMQGLEKDAPRPGQTPSITSAMVRCVIAKSTQGKPGQRDALAKRVRLKFVSDRDRATIRSASMLVPI